MPPTLVVLTPAHRPSLEMVRAAAAAGGIGVIDATADQIPARSELESLGQRWGLRARRAQLKGLDGLTIPYLLISDWRDSLEIARAHATHVVAEVTSVAEAAQAHRAGADIALIRGHEAGGISSPTTSFILLQLAAESLDAPYWIAGGMGPDTAAAAAVAGASGIVFCESLWLTRESPLDAYERERLVPLDGSETRWLANADGDAGERILPDEPGGKHGRPLGQEVGVAASVASRFATIGRALQATFARIADVHRDVANAAPLDSSSPLAAALGTHYPIAQGPMTRVSDVPDFGVAVAKAGALPFYALSMMRGPAVETLLADAATKLGDRPWGVGVLGFAPPQLRREQLEVIERMRPPYALIAGGHPAQAKQLEASGVVTFLHAPSPGLLRDFICAGARHFVLEGRECGGHVGPLSSFALWQQAVDVLRAQPTSVLRTIDVFFAGGIHDERSAAMIAALAAPLCERGLRVGVLMGSAYVCTEEAVTTGAVTSEFQRQVLSTTETTLLESGPGYAVRCAPTRFAAAFREHKQRLADAGKDPREARDELEELNVGRLRIATKGRTREGAQLRSCSPGEQLDHGLFMIGDVARLESKAQTVAQLHDRVCRGYRDCFETYIEASDSAAATCEPLAIVAMDGFFPESPSGIDFWRNIFREFCAIREVPSERWSTDEHFSPDRGNRDATYSKWGTFLDDIEFDPLDYGIPPAAMAQIEPVQLLALEVSSRALRSAGLELETFPRDRTSVVVAASGSHDLGLRYSFRTMARHFLPQVEGLEDKTRKEITRYLDELLPSWTEDSFPGFLMNVIAGRISNRLDLGGPNFAIDAACASSLAAVHTAAAQLRAGLCDVACVTAVDGTNNPFGFTAFAQTHALSPKGQSRPFDADADGIVLGEGVAAIVLRRLRDAERDGDRIRAVLRGIGSSSDGRYTSLTAPSPAGQRVALDRAYREAGIDPASIELFEAHSTGTAVGDRAEIASLQELLRSAGAEAETARVGSVKSMIGHTKTTAGLASLIKTVFALEQRVFPATIGVETPNEQLDQPASPLVVSAATRPWLGTRHRPRRAGVSAFGFGGTNFHAVLEEHASIAGRYSSNPRSAEPFVIGAATPAALLECIAELRAQAAQTQPRSLEACAATHASAHQRPWREPYRLGIVAASHEQLGELLDLAASTLRAGTCDMAVPNLVLSTAERLTSDQICFLFAGQGSQRAGMGSGLLCAHPELHDAIETITSAIDRDCGRHWRNALYPASREPGRELDDTRLAQPTLAVADALVYRLLGAYGVEPAVVAGHSFGEIAALWAAGVLDDDALATIAVARGRGCGIAGRGGTMAAVFADYATVAAELAARDLGVSIANINTPQQTVIAGPADAIKRACEHFGTKEIRCRHIAVSAPFHTAGMSAARPVLESALARIELAAPQLPVYSNETAGEHPRDPRAIAAALLDHLVRPVRYVDEINAIANRGIRCFIEVGPGRAQSNMVKRILGDDAIALATCDGDEWHSFLRCIVELAARGLDVDLHRAFQGRAPEVAAASKKSPTLWRIAPHRAIPVAGKPPSRPRPLAPTPPSKPATHTDHHPRMTETTMSAKDSPLLSSYQATMDKWLDLQKQQLDTQQAFLELQRRYLDVATGTSAPTHSVVQPAVAATELAPATVAPEPTLVSRPAASATPLPPPPPRTHVPASPMTQAAEPSSSAADDGVPSTNEFRRDLLAAVAARTGYPESMLGLDKDLASELGIDSIKIVEIFSSLDKYHDYLSGDDDNQEGNLEAFARLRTLGDIVESYDQQRCASGTEKQTHAKPLERSNIASRLVPCPEELPPCPSEGSLANGAVVLIGDIADITAGIRAGIEQRGERCIVLDRRRALPASPHVRSVDLADSRAVANALSGIGPVAGIVNLLPLGLTSDSSAGEGILDAASAWLGGLKGFAASAPPSEQRFVVNVTAIDGSFGYAAGNAGAALQATTIGMTKAIAKEWPKARVKALDLDPAWDAPAKVAAILQECFAGFDAVEVGRSRLGRNTIGLAPAPLPDGSPDLDDDAVVLVTGGAHGITAEALKTFAQSARPRLVIVGRSERPATLASPPASAAELRQRYIAESAGRNPAEIEQAVRSELKRQRMSENLAALESLSSSVEYRALDVTDDSALAGLIEDIYTRYGRLDGVIHGAGIIEDRHIADKDLQSFRRVLATKISSALTISRSVRSESLRFFVLFSSIAGRAGNAGQIDYAGANEFLNKLAAQLDRQWPGRVVAIGWGPWDAGMVDDGLKALYRQRGIGLVSIEDGAAHFMRELCAESGPAEVIITCSPEAIARA